MKTNDNEILSHTAWNGGVSDLTLQRSPITARHTRRGGGVYHEIHRKERGTDCILRGLPQFFVSDVEDFCYHSALAAGGAESR